MAQLLAKWQQLSEFDYESSLKILDHIEVMPNGMLVAVFKESTRISIE
jgi:hypothetical protein